MTRTVSHQMALGLRRRQDSVARTKVKPEWTRTLHPCEFLFMTLLSENLFLEGGKWPSGWNQNRYILLWGRMGSRSLNSCPLWSPFKCQVLRNTWEPWQRAILQVAIHKQRWPCLPSHRDWAGGGTNDMGLVSGLLKGRPRHRVWFYQTLMSTSLFMIFLHCFMW